MRLHYNAYLRRLSEKAVHVLVLMLCTLRRLRARH